MAQHFDPVKPPNLVMNSLVEFSDEFFGVILADGVGVGRTTGFLRV